MSELNALADDSVNRLAADYSADTIVNAADATALKSQLSYYDYNEYGMTFDVLNNWIVNPHRGEEVRQFYTDIIIPELNTSGQNIIVLTEKIGFSAEIIENGKLRLWCVKPPIAEVDATIVITGISGNSCTIVIPQGNIDNILKLNESIKNIYHLVSSHLNDNNELVCNSVDDSHSREKAKFKDGDIVILEFNLNAPTIECQHIIIDDIEYILRMPDNSMTSTASTSRRVFFKGTYILLCTGTQFIIINPSNYETIKLNNVTVLGGEDYWITGVNTFEDFPCRYGINIPRITTAYSPDVRFDYEEAMSGNFAPFATTASNYVYIYAKTVPTVDFTIPIIICERIATR